MCAAPASSGLSVQPLLSGRQVAALEQRLVSFVRAFGLHQPETTPCGQPMSVSEAHALAELHRHSSLGQKDLGALLRLEKSTVSRLVAKLDRRGWVQRAGSPTDARAVVLGLTPAGRRVATQLAGAREDRLARLLDAIPAGDRPLVLAALEILSDAAGNH